MFPRKVLCLQNDILKMKKKEKGIQSKEVLVSAKIIPVLSHFVIISLETEEAKALCNFPVTFSS